MVYCGTRVKKNTVDNLDELIESMPLWQKLVFGFLNLYPTYMLNSSGRKWQSILLFMLIPTLISGAAIGQYSGK